MINDFKPADAFVVGQ